MSKNLTLLAALLLIGCASHHDELSGSLPSGSLNTDLIEEEPVFFNEVFERVIAPNCLNCHGAYDSYQTVSENSLNILERIKGEGFGSPMPLGGPPLTDELVLLVETWVAQGVQDF